MISINWEKYKKVIKKEFSEKEETEGLKNYLFSSQLDKVNLILENIETIGGIHSRNIAITGDRGTGKTSFIETLKLGLEKKNYYVFDIVSPTVLSSHLNILEIVISSIYKKIDSFKDSHDIPDRSKLMQRLKKVMSAISVEKKQSDYFKQSKPEIEMLIDLSHRTFLDGEIKELFCYFKKLLNNNHDSCKEEIKDLVLIVDDLDLVENDLVYGLLRDIQHYLDSQLIIIFAYKEGQLEQSMFEYLAKDNDSLLKYNVINSNAIFGQIERFLTKLVPLSNRIPLFKQDELLNKTIGEFLSSLDPSYGVGENFEFTTNDVIANKNHLTIREWFYESIFYRTNLKIEPIDVREEASRLMPKTLREMVQFCEELDSMKVIPLETSRKEKVQALKSNLVYLKRYIDYKNTSQFNQKQLDFLSRWELSNSYQANYLTYHFLFNSSQDVDKKVYPFDRASYEAHNLTLGDVYAMMEEIKFSNFATGETLYFIYTLKIMYSIRLSTLLYNVVLLQFENKIFDELNSKSVKYYSGEIEIVDYKSEVEEVLIKYPDFHSYLDLINTQFMPSKFNYYKGYEPFLIEWKGLKGEHTLSRLFKELFLNSEVSFSGDIRMQIDSDTAYRYRSLYSYLPLNLQGQGKGQVVFFLFATKVDFVAWNIFQFCLDSTEGGREGIPYFMTSMFHIDTFIRHNYMRQSENKPFDYMLNQIASEIWKDVSKRAFSLQKWYSTLDTILGNEIIISIPLKSECVMVSEIKREITQAYETMQKNIELKKIEHLPLAKDVKSNEELRENFSEAIARLEKLAGVQIKVGNLSQFRNSLRNISIAIKEVQELSERIFNKRILSLDFVEEFIRTVNKLGEADESN
ncbi:TPA: P-loop NTPase fold protein [Streptococcus suis]